MKFCFPLQSYFHLRGPSVGSRNGGSISAHRQRRTFALLIALFLSGVGIANTAAPGPLMAFGLGMTAPGAGFLAWANPGSDGALLAASLAVLTMALFALSLIGWFATGNILAPPIVWAAGAVMAIQFEGSPWPAAGWVVPGGLAALVAAGFVVLRVTSNIPPPAAKPAKRSFPIITAPNAEELGTDDLALIRLLLDRALQPVDRFDGFDWRDQFQTAAVRYQLNFMSYALSMTQMRYLPAFDGYWAHAQDNLALKMMDHRIWRYWRLENIWGNLDTNSDPIARDNVMFSGFFAAQLTLAANASGRSPFSAPGSIVLQPRRGAPHVYDLPRILETVAGNIQAAPYGLVPCEPNWIYPLCNAIAMTGLRAGDAATGADHWHRLAPEFEHALATEFTRPNGDLVPFRSSVTGLAPPPVGGAVMQAFPCYFLNATLPHVARHHWDRTAPRLTEDRFRKELWPIDVGNYGFTRASSYAASAAAAREMGDHEVADRLLTALDEECPAVSITGARHRPRASLWAHAVEVLARVGHQGSLAQLTSTGANAMDPRLVEVAYPDVAVARAVAVGGGLDLVLRPVGEAVATTIRISGLPPESSLRVTGGGGSTEITDRNGEAAITLNVGGRTPVTIRPTGG